MRWLEQPGRARRALDGWRIIRPREGSKLGLLGLPLGNGNRQCIEFLAQALYSYTH